jgi:hypothetical protein
MRGRLGWLCRRGRTIHFDVCDRVPFDMVRVETVTRSRKIDYLKSAKRT